MPPKKPERARVDLSMGSSFRRPLNELASRESASPSQGEVSALAGRAGEILRSIENSYVINDNNAFTEAVSDALAILGIRLRDLGLERNGFLTRIERGVEQSAVIPTGLKEGFVAKLRDAVDALVIEGREGASRRARQRHAKALTPMLSAVAAESDLRRRIVLSKERSEKLIASSVRTAPDGTRERHADLAPFVAGVISDDETRYYLSLAIDDDVQRRSDEAIEDIEAKREQGEDVFVPVVCIGTGVYGQVVANELMSELPDVMERDVMFVDAADHLGGQFAVGTRAVFKVNNRVRPEDPESLARPGTPDNIMPLGDHSVIDLPAVSAQTYPSQNLLGGCLKTNLYLNTHQNMTEARVVGVIKNPAGSSARYTVEFVRDNQLYRITTNIVTIADGIGESKVGFTDEFDVATRELIAESRKATERDETPQYYSFQDFVRLASREESGNWREKLAGEGIVIGAGDSGIVTVAAVLGYGPDDVGSTQLDFIRQATWIGQSADNAEAWCDSARPRYVDLAREFPRETIQVPGSRTESVTRSTDQVFLTDRRKLLEPIRIAFEQFQSNESPVARAAYLNAVTTARTEGVNFPLSISNPNANLSKFSIDYYQAENTIEQGEAVAQSVVEREREKITELLSDLEEFKRSLAVTLNSQAFLNAFNQFAGAQSDKYLNIPGSTFDFPLRVIGDILFPNNPVLPGYDLLVISAGYKLLQQSPSASVSGSTLFPESERVSLLKRIDTVVRILTREREQREKQLALAQGTNAVLSDKGEAIQGGYSRIVPVKEKAVRAERFTDEKTGKNRVRVFCEGGRVVEADWIIDASGVTSRTNELFRDFSAPEQRERKVPNPTEAPFETLFKTPGFQIQLSETARSPFLRGISLRCLRVGSAPEVRKAFAIVRVKTQKNQEFQFECVRTAEDEIRVITSTNDYDAAQIARALEDWNRTKEAIADDAKIIGGAVPDIFAERQRTTVGLLALPVGIKDPDTLIPVASKLICDGEGEGIYFLGPTNRFPLSEEERKQIPALSKVTANLASMFRYVNPTAKFVSEVLAPEIERQASRDSLPSIITADRQERALWRGVTEADPVEVRIPFVDVGKDIPSIANPRVLVRYLVRRATMENMVQLPEEESAERLPNATEFRITRRKNEEDYVLTCSELGSGPRKLWNLLSEDTRFVQSLILALRPKGSGGTYRFDTRSGEILAATG